MQASGVAESSSSEDDDVMMNFQFFVSVSLSLSAVSLFEQAFYILWLRWLPVVPCFILQE